MSSADGIDIVYLDGKGEEKYRVMSKIPEDLQQHANVNWKSFKRWYHANYGSPDAGISKQAKRDMDRILMRHDGHHPVDRTELCNGTIAVLDAWTAVSLVPASKDSRFARVRMLRDIIYERSTNPMEFARLPACDLLSRMQQSLLTDPTLAPLHLTKGEVSDAAHWIYRTGGGKFAKHQVFRQPFSYPVLARDGVSTLHPSFSQDNYHIYGGLPVSSVPSIVSPLSSLPIKRATASSERFHPYPRPRTVEQPSRAILDENTPPPCPIACPAPSTASANNEVTLDELIEEAKNNSAIMGYTEALNRGLLRHKGSRVQWVPDLPATTEHEQIAEDAKIHGRRIQVLEGVSNGSATSKRDPAVEDAMSQVPQIQISESLAKESKTSEREQVAEDVILQTPPVQNSKNVLIALSTAKREQLAYDTMFQIPQVQIYGGVPSIASPDDEPFEHVRYLDSRIAKQ
ncbi:MAG: hypothetical protein Q9205_005880 [Flavoplaca limonia]